MSLGNGPTNILIRKINGPLRGRTSPRQVRDEVGVGQSALSPTLLISKRGMFVKIGMVTDSLGLSRGFFLQRPYWWGLNECQAGLDQESPESWL